MDEFAAAEAWRIDASAFDDRHAVLHPEQRLCAIRLRQQKPRPAGIARARGKQLRQGGAGRRRQAPAFTQPAGELTNFGRTASAAGDQGKASCHTTRNVYVLLLFFFSQIRERSQSFDSNSSGSVLNHSISGFTAAIADQG
jgi:hypothetical protein